MHLVISFMFAIIVNASKSDVYDNGNNARGRWVGVISDPAQ